MSVSTKAIRLVFSKSETALNDGNEFFVEKQCDMNCVCNFRFVWFYTRTVLKSSHSSSMLWAQTTWTGFHRQTLSHLLGMISKMPHSYTLASSDHKFLIATLNFSDGILIVPLIRVGCWSQVILYACGINVLPNLVFNTANWRLPLLWRITVRKSTV